MKKYWPIIVLAFVELGIILTNVTPHTILAGWDNLFPEFNLPLNFSRSIFGVWLEYRGLGLYDGMSHIANLLHTLAVWIMSFVIPKELLRYSFILGMHLLGGIGAYILIKNLFNRHLGFVGGLFYMLNLGTIQMFFTPLEAYSVYFACLPWLSWGLWNFYSNNTKKSFVIFLIIALLSTPTFFVTTLLLPITILLGLLSLTFLLNNWKLHLRRVLMAGVGFLLINAFWLLPYLWGLPNNAPVIASAKINQMGSGEIFSRNRAFGDMQNVLKLRGFSLDFEDLNNNNVSVNMMGPWRNFVHTPVVKILTGLAAIIALIGLGAVLSRPKHRAIGFALTFLIGFVFLGTDVPGLRDVTIWLQNNIPFFKEAFRFSFTKFGLPFVLAYSIMFVTGLSSLIGHKVSKNTVIITIVLTTGTILFLSWPAFQGNFLYKNLRIQMPNEYQQFFEFAKTLDPNGRMAILPQPSYWSWKYYRFGYRGSGFLWMGVPQPTMDRAFDPWSATNEGYYWELSYALYSKNGALLQNVLRKYDITYVIMDENLLSFSNNRALFTDETKELLTQIPGIQKTATFGKITVYKRTDNASQSFVSIQSNLPSVNAYTWTDNDVAYTQLGAYLTSSFPGVTYPYRSLFTKRSVTQRDFDANALIPASTIVYDSTKSADLSPANVKECGLLKDGNATAGEIGGTLQFQSLNQRGCLSFDIPTLSHKFSYLVTVDSRHITGRPLMISFINDTAKHVELETYLGTGTDYFILPPLAPDGLGYTIYVSNDSIGRYESINDLSRIRIYQIPYNELVSMHSGGGTSGTVLTNFTVFHPNPSFYTVVTRNSGTLILSQSYDPGWVAWSGGKMLPHVLVNNWKNGWLLNPGTSGTIYILFWPQLLEFIGFLLLPIPFLAARKMHS